MADLTTPQKEFLALIKSVGWRPADAARALKLTPTSIHRYVNGIQPPSKEVMKTLKRLVVEEGQRLASLGLQMPSDANLNSEVVLAELDAAIDALTRARQLVSASAKKKRNVPLKGPVNYS